MRIQHGYHTALTIQLCRSCYADPNTQRDLCGWVLGPIMSALERGCDLCERRSHQTEEDRERGADLW